MAKNKPNNEYCYIGMRPECKLYPAQDKARFLSDYVALNLARYSRMIEITGLPDTMPERSIKMMLLCNGSIFVTESIDSKTKQKGLYGIVGGLGGEPSPYYMPTKYVIANPALTISKSELTIGLDGVLIRNNSTFTGILPIIEKYGSMLAENWLSIRNASIWYRENARIVAESDNAKKAAEDYLRHIENGDLAVIGSRKVLDQPSITIFPTGTTHQPLTELIELNQYLLSRQDMELGLNSNWNAKRESINSNESQLNTDGLRPLVDDILLSWREGFDEVNAMYNKSISVSLASAWESNKREEDAALEKIENESEKGDENDAKESE